MTSQPREKTIAIQILPNISKSKANRTVKFGWIIKYNMTNIFAENHTQNVMGNLLPFPF